MTIPEKSIGLDKRVNEVYPFGVPLIDQPHRTENLLAHYIESLPVEADEEGPATAAADRVAIDPAVTALARRVVALLADIRADRPPSSALHALLLRDWQDVGSIAAVIDCDLETAEAELDLLVDSGIVHTRVTDGFREFSIVWQLVVAR